MNKSFKKGQEVTYIASWDDKGTFYFRHAVVYSCGAKQMVLTDAATGAEMGRHFRPEAGDLTDVCGFIGGTFPRMTDEEATATCLALAARYIERSRAHYIERSSHPSYSREGCLKSLAELHEPRAQRR